MLSLDKISCNFPQIFLNSETLIHWSLDLNVAHSSHLPGSIEVHLNSKLPNCGINTKVREGSRGSRELV